MDKLYLVSIIFLGIWIAIDAAPAACRACRGNCKNNERDETFVGNVTDTELLDALVDNDTGKLLNLNLTSAELDEISANGDGTGQRAKRDSFIEKRTCSSQFQLELFMIPVSIAMIPLALVSLLLCVCFCGPEDSRGHAPEKIMGVRLSQKRRTDDVDEIAKAKNSRMKKSASDEELEYHNGYVQRKDSKKTRFATNVLFIEPLRRASSVSCLEGMNSRRGSTAAALAQQGPPTVHVGCKPFDDPSTDDTDNDKPKELRKQTRFSDSVSVICEDDPFPKSAASKKRAKCMQRSISVPA